MEENNSKYLESLKKKKLRRLLPNNLYSQVSNPIIYSILYRNKEISENLQEIKTSTILWFYQSRAIIDSIKKLVKSDKINYNYSKLYNTIRFLSTFARNTALKVEKKQVPTLNYLGESFQSLIKDSPKNEFNAVIAVTLDRISRFWEDILYATSEFERHNKELIVVNRKNIDTKLRYPYSRKDYLYRGLLNIEEIHEKLRNKEESESILNDLLEKWFMETEFVIESFHDFSNKILSIYGLEEKELFNLLKELSDSLGELNKTVSESGKQIIEFKAGPHYEPVLEDKVQLSFLNFFRKIKRDKSRLKEYILSLFNADNSANMNDFENLNHNELINRYCKWISYRCKQDGISVQITRTHGLHDSGVDISIELKGKIEGVVGFQIKSHNEIIQDGFNDVMSKDIADADRHNIDLYTIIFCANRNSKEKNKINEKISYQVNRINQKQSRDFFILIDPEEATKFHLGAQRN